MESTPTVKMCAHWDCRAACVLECARCRLVAYCGPEHQKESHSHHKLVCGKGDALDGWVVAGAVYKALECLDPRLDRVEYHACWVEMRTQQQGIGNTVTFGMRVPQETNRRINSLQDFVATDRRDARRSEGDKKLRAMTYWALRCMMLGATANHIFCELLKQARQLGYKYLVFGAATALSLEPEIALELIKVKSRHTVIVKGLRPEPLREPEVVCHWVVTLGHYAIDLTAARFWVFRGAATEDVRPLLVCDKRDYSVAMGEAGPVIDNLPNGAVLDRDGILREELARHDYWVPARGIAQGTLEDCLKRQPVSEEARVVEEQRQEKQADELMQWIQTQEAKLAQLTIDGPADAEAKRPVNEVDGDALTLKTYVSREKPFTQ